MRKIHFIVKFIVAYIVATFAAAMCIRYDASDNVVIMVYFCTAIVIMLALGALDDREKNANAKYDSIKHKRGLKEAA